MKYTEKAVAFAKKTNNKTAAAQWAGIRYGLSKNPTNSDLYAWGISNYQAGMYKTSDSIFCGMYIPKYPNEIYGYLWCARSKRAQDDSLGSQGLAVEAWDKLAQMGRQLDSTAKAGGTADSAKYLSQVRDAYFSLAQYYNDIKKDKPTAILYLEKVLEVDPTNATALKFRDILRKPARQPATKPRPATGTH